MSKLAKDIGVSDVAIAKACRRADIPTPGLGYWAKLHHGKTVKRIPLPPPSEKTRTVVQISPSESKSQLGDLPPEIQEKIARESTAERRITVPKTLSKTHPIVRRWLDLARRQTEGGRKLSPERPGQSRIGAKMERRRLRILAALFEAIERRGFKVVANPQNPYDLAFVVEGERIEFSVQQRHKQFTEDLTPEELRSPLNATLGIKSRTILRPTDTPVFKIHSWIGMGMRTQWRDTTRKPLEEQLNNIVAGLLAAAAMIHRHRVEREEEQRRLLAERIEREKQEEARRNEGQRLQGLLEGVARWLQAANVRAYVSAVHKAARTDRAKVDPVRLKAWASWALAHADRMDPINVGDSLIGSASGVRI